MIRKSRILCLVSFVCLFLLGDVPLAQAQGSSASQSGATGFEASISGSYEGKVAGAGVLKFLPGAGFGKRGYYFLADGQGVRPFGVTFVLPRGLAPGRHTLKSPTPLDLGNMPSVRVDRVRGKSVISADRNTSGFLNLDAFPSDEKKLTGSDVRGNFEFETAGPRGARIRVKGRFSFKVR